MVAYTHIFLAPSYSITNSHCSTIPVSKNLQSLLIFCKPLGVEGTTQQNVVTKRSCFEAKMKMEEILSINHHTVILNLVLQHERAPFICMVMSLVLV